MKSENKKVVISVILFLFVLLNASAQNETPAEYKKIMLGLSFSPDYCSRVLKSKPSYNSFVEERNDTEIPKFGFTTGLNLLMRLDRKLDLESGIFYSNKGYKTQKQNLFWLDNNKDVPVNYQVIYTYQYFDIPLKLNYYFITSRIRFFLTSGISLNIFNRQQIKLKLEEANGNRSSSLSQNDLGFSSVNLELLTGVGMFYTLSDRMHLKVQPIYRTSLTSLTSSTMINEKLYSIGVDIGFYFTFKKK